MTKPLTKAVYAGSFDPFTTGHLFILKESAKLFDQVDVLICSNPDKPNRFTNADKMWDVLEDICKRERLHNVNVTTWDRLVADYCKSDNATYLIRGLRNTSDYLYEENIAAFNSEVFPELRTIYIRASDNVVSSTLVRELYKHDQPVSKYLPGYCLGGVL